MRIKLKWELEGVVYSEGRGTPAAHKDEGCGRW